MHRLFVALPLPQSVRDLLIDAMDESPELGWVGEDNLHLTLRFIGAVERPVANDIAAALAAIRSPAFELSIAGSGIFDRRSGGAIWAAVDPREPVAALAAKVDRALVTVGLEPERRAFHPHIALARYKRPSAAAARDFVERSRALASEPFQADRFNLYESHLTRHGAHYETVAEFPLH